MKKHIFAISFICLLLEFPSMMASHFGSPDVLLLQRMSKDKLTFKIISGESDTWGYDIFSNGKKMIHQPSKPGIPGNLGFKTKKMAEMVARKIIKKIRRGEMPPSISQEEMDKMGVY